MNDIQTWSFSAWNLFANQCKFAYKKQYIDKIKKEDNYFQSKGQTDHKVAEYHTLGKVTGTPAQLENFKREMDILKKKKGVLVEHDLAITKAFEPTKWNDWHNVWCRGKSDIALPMNKSETEILLIDHKFGKRWGDYAYQMKNYFFLSVPHFPNAKKFVTELWFHKLGKNDNGRIERVDFSIDDYKKTKSFWVKEWNKMKTEEEFAPNPSKFNCQYCFYANDKTGHCMYNSKGEL